MSMKDRIVRKMFAGKGDASRLNECIDAGIAKVAKMGHLTPEEVRANFDANLMMMGFSLEEVQRLHADAETETAEKAAEAEAASEAS